VSHENDQFKDFTGVFLVLLIFSRMQDRQRARL
jgi:hypothetical protein